MHDIWGEPFSRCCSACFSRGRRGRAVPQMVPGGVSPELRLLLLVDGPASRSAPEAIEYARSVGVDMVLLPGALTHILQPMDALFGLVKRDYFAKMRRCRVSTSHVPGAQWAFTGRKSITRRNLAAPFLGTMPPM